MSDQVTKEGIDRTAAQLVETARKNGQNIKFEDAQKRIAQAVRQGDQKRSERR